MEENRHNSIPLVADLFLIHAPSVYDFRERDDMMFAYLSDSDSVNITSIFEMYPIGFLSIKKHLINRGFQAEIVNLASLMLMHPDLNVDKLLQNLEAPVYGLDLHWMSQCHGSLEIAKIIKHLHPDALVIFGGISATYFADELIQYEAVDAVFQGYDTLEPVTSFVECVKRGELSFDKIPNLLYKRSDGEIISTGFTHKPLKNYNNATVDWSFYKSNKITPTSSNLIMTLPNTGCAYDCSWCGGSRFAYRKIMGLRETFITKDHERIIEELKTFSDAAHNTSIYALQCYSESTKRLNQYLDAVKEIGYKKVFFEQFHLTDQKTLRKMGESTQSFIMLSPESHDPLISRLAGRGNYTMAEMEEWIKKALDVGIAGIYVWFFIGMPQQTPESVLETVSYCESLLKKFQGKNVLPIICPMVPFLDPGSRFFEEPEKHGYRLYYKTLEQHRRAMLEPLWFKRLNYDTIWMSRHDIQNITYKAVAKLVNIKGEFGLLPQSFVKNIISTIDETTFLLREIERSLEQDGRLSSELRNDIRFYNRKILAYSTDQIIPIPRPYGGRWFDDFTVPKYLIDICKTP